MEHAHKSALENHVHRPPRLGRHRSLNLRIGIKPADGYPNGQEQQEEANRGKRSGRRRASDEREYAAQIVD
jgi:hypothetical protein